MNLTKFLIVCLSALLVSACTKVDQCCDANPASVIEGDIVFKKGNEPIYTFQTVIDGIRFPDSTKVEFSEDGKRMRFQFPEGFRFVYREEGGEIGTTGRLWYVCTCSGSGGCSPYLSGVGAGCLHGTCSGSCSGEWVDDENPHHRPSQLEGAFVNLSYIGVTYVRSRAEFEKLVAFDSLVLNIPKIAETYSMLAMEQIGFMYLDPSYPNCEMKIVAMNFYGSLIAAEVPVSFIEAKGGYDAFTLVKCKCLVGSGCVPKPLPNGTVVCQGGNCSKCAISPDDPNNPTD